MEEEKFKDNENEKSDIDDSLSEDFLEIPIRQVEYGIIDEYGENGTYLPAGMLTTFFHQF